MRVKKPGAAGLRMIFYGSFGVAILMTGGLLIFVVSHLLSPADDSLLDKITERARTGVNDSQSNAERANRKADELADYADCAADAVDIFAIEKCKDALSPDVRIGLLQDETRPKEPELLHVPLLADCVRKATVAEKTICEHPKLAVLNTELAKYTDRRKQSRNPADLYGWWRDVVGCEDQVPCLQKQLDDEIFRATH